MNNLLPITSLNAVEVFSSPETVQILLDEIKKQATDFKPDATTTKGRKEIASRAFLVSQSKTFADKAGKSLTDGWLEKKRAVDGGRKQIREFCDNLRDEIRVPLEEYKAARALMIEEKRLKDELEEAERMAHEENELVDREAKMAAWEEQQELERLEKEFEENERAAEVERKNRDARIRRETRARAAKAVKDAKDAKLKAQEDLETEKQKGIIAAAAAKKRAAQDKADAVAKAKREAEEKAEQVEIQRLQVIEMQNRETEKRAADRKHRGKINTAIVDALVKLGFEEEIATSVVTLIASGKVPSTKIEY